MKNSLWERESVCVCVDTAVAASGKMCKVFVLPVTRSTSLLLLLLLSPPALAPRDAVCWRRNLVCLFVNVLEAISFSRM